MPRTRPMTREELREKHRREREERIRGDVGSYVERKRITKRELAGMIGMPWQTFYKRLEAPGSFRLEELWALREVIGGGEE